MTALRPKAQSVLRPDPVMIARFAETIFGYTEGPVPVRMLREKGQAPGFPWSETLVADTGLGAHLVRLAGRAAGDQRALYVVPATLSAPGRATTSNIAQTAVLPIDLDTGDSAVKRDHLIRHLGPPALIVASGGITETGAPRLHLYWRLTEAARGVDLDRVSHLRREIARKAAGDPSFASLHQPIRVAGSLNLKVGTMALASITGGSDRDHDLDEIAQAVAAMPMLPGCEATFAEVDSQANGASASRLMTSVVREGGIDGITRFDAISRVIGHWIRQVRLGRASREQAWQAVLEHNAAMLRPPFEDDRLRRDFDALLARDAANHGAIPDPATERHTASDSTDEPRAPDLPPALSEDALAASFTARHGADWRHVPAWGRWLHWRGTHWADDDTARLRDIIRHVCRSAATGCDKPGEARRIASDRTIRAVIAIAAADPAIALGTTAWDRDPDLLNTPGGIVDLATGEVRRHDRGSLMTQITAASPGQGCPRWRRFIDEITGGDPDLAGYLQRLAGYCLTGSTAEQAFVFLHGHGANGKSVFLQTLTAILGTYARTAPQETFMAARVTGHPTELAGLRGARLVVVTETEANRAWAESRIKAITGGDPIAARFMHRDFFEFLPTFKLLVAGNHRPRLTGVGEAMRRRLHLVPFEVTIPEADRDKTLCMQLLAERDGILGWMIAGCADWRRIGLAPPARVLAASQDYFADEDVIGHWIAEQCETGPGCSARAADLYTSWSTFAETGGFETGSRKSLGNELGSRGFVQIRTGGSRGWVGIALRRGVVAP